MSDDPKKLKFRELLDRLTASGADEAELVAKEREHHEGMQRSLLGSRLDAWGVGARERAAVLERGGKLVDTPAVRWVRHMAETPAERSLVLWGGNGCGKSVAAALWISLAARRPIVGHPRLGDTWEWDNACKFVGTGELHRRYASFEAEDRFWAEDVRNCRALVLDDLGTERFDIVAHVADVIWERNRQDRLTVITTNMPPEAFAQKYDQRAADRLLQDGHFRACGAENLRRG